MIHINFYHIEWFGLIWTIRNNLFAPFLSRFLFAFQTINYAWTFLIKISLEILSSLSGHFQPLIQPKNCSFWTTKCCKLSLKLKLFYIVRYLSKNLFSIYFLVFKLWLFTLIDWLIDFYGTSTFLVLFHIQRLGNRVHCTFILIFLWGCF